MRDRKIIQPRVDMRGFELTITLLRCEIEYDVDFETWKVGDVSGLPGKERAGLETSEETADWMFRQVNDALSEATGHLRAFSPWVQSRAVTDEVKDDREWIINLVMERGWRGDPRRLAVYIHRFVGDSVLSFWYRMVDPSRVQMYASQKEEDRRNIIKEARETQVEDVYFRL